MSNVVSRKRSLSELEFWKNAMEIRANFARYLMNEKHVPKRWRPVFTFPGIDYARRLMEEITASNTIYPTTDAELSQRRAHQNEAIVACELMIQHIQFMIDTLDGVSVSDFKELGEMIFKEEALIKAWRKQNKILTQKQDQPPNKQGANPKRV
jgi:hypothetical protein